MVFCKKGFTLIRSVVIFTVICLVLQVGFASPEALLKDMKKLVAKELVSTSDVEQDCEEHLRFLIESRPDLNLSAELIGSGYYGLFAAKQNWTEDEWLENEMNKIITKYVFPAPHTMPPGLNIRIDDEQGKTHHFYIKSRRTANTSYIVHTPFGREAFGDPLCVSHVLSIADQIKAFQEELEKARLMREGR